MFKKIKNRQSTLLSILVLPVFFSGLFAGISPCQEDKPADLTLEFWSVYDDSDVYDNLIREFNEEYPYIAINYHKKDYASYEKELVDALAAGRGPDIFSIHNTWLPKHQDKLAAAPSEIITPKKFQEIFVDVAVADFVGIEKAADGMEAQAVYAFPFYIDTLALYYNRDLLNSAGVVKPPATWLEFNSAVEKITLRDAQNNITRVGAALGTAKNINRSTDILSLLMLQNGTQMVSSDKKYATFNQPISQSNGESFNAGENALSFYANFAKASKKVYTWNQYQHYSIDAFVEGKVAMMLNYAYQIPLIKARSPHLNFGVAAVPQISSTGPAVTYANYWGQAVSKTSPNAIYAWTFLAWLAGKDNAQVYLEKTDRPASRRDLVEWQKSDPGLGIRLTARPLKQF